MLKLFLVYVASDVNTHN